MRYVVIVDTETTSLEPSNAFNTCLVYDLGYVISDTAGNIVCERSFINDDVFNNASLMNSAYYASKLPTYHANINNEWEHTTTLKMWHTFMSDLKQYNIKPGDVFAYNASFDMKALNYTIKHYSNGFITEWIPRNMWRDVWVIAGKAITSTNKYVRYCMRHNLLTERCNPSTSAETVFKYLTGDSTFVEQHTALSDSRIEHYILMQCFKRHAAMPSTLGHGWRYAARVKRDMQ